MNFRVHVPKGYASSNLIVGLVPTFVPRLMQASLARQLFIHMHVILSHQMTRIFWHDLVLVLRPKPLKSLEAIPKNLIKRWASCVHGVLRDPE